MLRLRALLLWIFVIALPLQGYAAAAMVFCALPQAALATVEDQAHANAHDHAGHEHAAHRHDGMSTPSDPHDASKSASAEPDGFHKCGICAACHTTALPNTLQWPVFADLPRADPALHFDAMPTPLLRVLDKPPRA